MRLTVRAFPLLAFCALAACGEQDNLVTDAASAPAPPLPEAQQGTPSVRQAAGFGSEAGVNDVQVWTYVAGTERGELNFGPAGAAEPVLRLTCMGGGLLRISFAAATDANAARPFSLASGEVSAGFQGDNTTAGSAGASSLVSATTTGRDPVIVAFGRSGRLRLQEGGRTIEADAAPAEAAAVARFFQECP